jgi:hypothetical protein
METNTATVSGGQAGRRRWGDRWDREHREREEQHRETRVSLLDRRKGIMDKGMWVHFRVRKSRKHICELQQVTE